MADYSFNFQKGYATDTGVETGGFSGSPTAPLENLTDNDPASTFFETSDTAIDDEAGALFFDNGTYLGSFVQTIDGVDVTFLVVRSFGPASASTTYAIANLPSSLTSSGAQVNDLLPDTLPTLNTAALAECFAAGTMIATPDGECAVEDLAIGDVIVTADGHTVPVRWVGRQTLHKIFTPPHRFTPVRVKAGALGDGLPHADLVLTADHALIIDGLAINAGALVNEITIAFEPFAALPERITLYHVETESHDVILANGAPAETFIDYLGRGAFDNYEEYLSLYGDQPVIAEMPFPRVSSRRQLPSDLRQRLQIADFAEDVTNDALAFLAERGAA